MLNIRSDNKWHQFIYSYDVPDDVLEDQFDYQDREEVTDEFILYLGNWYHLDQFERSPPGGDLDKKGWVGYHGDSYFLGIVIKISPDGEEYKIGTYIEDSRTEEEAKAYARSPEGRAQAAKSRAARKSNIAKDKRAEEKKTWERDHKVVNLDGGCRCLGRCACGMCR